VHQGPICVAMLPFKNLTGDPKLDFLGGGMMEAVLTDLGGQHGLHVIEHDQIQADIDYMKFTNDAKVSDPKTRAELGKIQGCETVLIGGYQKWNGRIRATARILQVETGAVLVAAKVDRPEDHVFELQDAVATELHKELPALEKALRP
jgi:TolB-like protein